MSSTRRELGKQAARGRRRGGQPGRVLEERNRQQLRERNRPVALRFNGGRRPRELRIKRNTSVSWEGQPTGSRGVPSIVRIHSSGCYGVQIDGTDLQPDRSLSCVDPIVGDVSSPQAALSYA